MRRFIFVRDQDASGVSGTGVVAEGVRFATGRCALSWLTNPSSLGIYNDVAEMMQIHSHGGATRLEWLDSDG